MTDDELVTVVLSCLHTLNYKKPAPRIGETIFCRRCDTYKNAVIPPESYRVVCRDCTRGPTRDYGRAILRAEVDADKHARKFPGHRVRVLNGTGLVSERMQASPPTLMDVPPF